jgi:transcriptional regulator with XRE-family HTH domain
VLIPRLKEWREARGMIQNELARVAGVSKFTIVRIEGGANTHPDTARKLADALGVDVTDLMNEPPVSVGKAQAPSTSGQQEQSAEEEARRLSTIEGQAVSELWQSGLAVLYREIAKKGRAIADRMKAGRLEGLEELVEFGKASAVLAKLRGPRDILGRESDELAEAIDEFEAADTDIQAVLRQDLFANLSEEQRRQIAEFQRRRSAAATESAAYSPRPRRPADASSR